MMSQKQHFLHRDYEGILYDNMDVVILPATKQRIKT